MRERGEITYRGHIIGDWLDHNRHMNLGFYLVVFDNGTGGLYENLVIGEATRGTIGHSMFTLEARVIYLKELFIDDNIRIETRILGYDHNKIHYMHWMINEQNDEICAINELMGINVDINTRKSISFSDDTLSRLAILSTEHHNYPMPEEAGCSIRQIGFPEKE